MEGGVKDVGFVQDQVHAAAANVNVDAASSSSEAQGHYGYLDLGGVREAGEVSVAPVSHLTTTDMLSDPTHTYTYTHLDQLRFPLGSTMSSLLVKAKELGANAEMGNMNVSSLNLDPLVSQVRDVWGQIAYQVTGLLPAEGAPFLRYASFFSSKYFTYLKTSIPGWLSDSIEHNLDNLSQNLDLRSLASLHLHLSERGINLPPELIVSSFALTLALLVVGGLEGFGEEGANDEWARLAAEEGEEEPEELKVYDPEVAKAFFLQRPVTLITRGWRSSILLGQWSIGLYLDAKLNRRPEDDEDKKAATDAKRASQLRSILIRLGPTYVKLGQVLSSRQDLLPPPYVQELQSLQDSVPPFDDAVARRMIARELGMAAAGRIEYLKASPVASASLGQVYECMDTYSGKKVAVKVQRPGALCAVSLDVAIIRLIGPILYKINDKDGNLDAEALVDEWGSRFVDELDYRMEATNAAEFQSAMNGRKDTLGQSVFAPEVLPDMSARRILTAQWVEGKRIDESVGDQRGRLCAVTLSAYLAMLLETGTLHVDPHPGNLLVAEDGRVCILDWGLVTNVTLRQRQAILTFISHLVSGDYNVLDNDLAVMGFVPPEKIGALNDAGLTRAIGVLFAASAQGGGATGFRKELGFSQTDEELREMGKEIRKIKGRNKKETEQLRRDAFIEMTGGEGSKVAQLSRDLEQVQKKYGNIFTIPSYFAYILRCFSVLEGIGLATDSGYSIAKEAFPYVARRLLTDRSETTRKALNQLLYGREGNRLSVDQAKQLAEAFGSYSEIMTESTSSSPPGGEGAASSSSSGAKEAMPSGVKEALRVAFAPEGGPLQDILLKEAARLTGASTASALNTTLSTAFQESHAAVQYLAEQSPLLKQVVSNSPFPTPLEVYQGFLQPGLESAASQGGTDTDAAEVAAIISGALSGDNEEGQREDQKKEEDAAAAGFPGVVLPTLPSPEAAQEALDLAIELAPGIQLAAVRFGSTLLWDAAERLGSAAAAAGDGREEQSSGSD